MATPTPSPRALASPIVTLISSLPSRAWPRHALRISAPYGASAIPAASCTDRDTSTSEAAAASSPQNTRMGVREPNASGSSPSAPVLRAI